MTRRLALAAAAWAAAAVAACAAAEWRDRAAERHHAAWDRPIDYWPTGRTA